MTDGTSQGLFIVVAIVIFGIFVVLAYILFEDTLSPALANMFTDATEQSSLRLNNRYRKELVGSWNYEVTATSSEFMRYADVATIIDEHGIDTTYIYEFEIKATKSGEVRLNHQNGSGSKYQITLRHPNTHIINATETYTKHQIIAGIKLDKAGETESFLSFYGIYGTSVYPSVKNLRIYKVSE